MVIAITGANGTIGAALIRHLHEVVNVRAESLRAVVRSAGAAHAVRDLPAEIVRVDYRDTSSLTAAFEGARGVVHLAGALRPRRGESLYDANAETTHRVVAAAQSAGVETLVYLSAPGASQDSPNDYLRTKGMAEDVVRSSGLRGAVFRVPMVLGRASPSLWALRHMAMARVVPLVGGGRVRVQPIAQDDVVAAIRWALGGTPGPVVALDLVGPDTLWYRDLLRKIAQRFGKTPHVLYLPKGLVEASARVASWVPALGWNWTMFDTLFNEHLADASEAQSILPFELTRIDSLLERLPDQDPA